MGLHVKYTLLLFDFNETWVLSTVFFSKNTQIKNFMKLRPVGAELFYADRGTDMTTLIVTFRNFANAPKNHFRRFKNQISCSRKLMYLLKENQHTTQYTKELSSFIIVPYMFRPWAGIAQSV
jgi:hypothetical protein